jgi:spoIIIJ-associated protein
MIETNEIKSIKLVVESFFDKMTTPVSKTGISTFLDEDSKTDVVKIDVNLEEPQILIGQGGQTLFEIQRVLRMMLSKKINKVFYLDLDINEYKNKKSEYLKNLAKDLADQVSLNKEIKVLSPMPSYERRILHKELGKRADIVSESQGEGIDRHIVVKPK